jgi:PAS domain S-box-containing protein
MAIVQLARQHRGYVVAVVATLAIIVARKLLLDPLLTNEVPLRLFIVAVIAAAWSGGLGPGLLATLLGLAAGLTLFGNLTGGSIDWSTALVFTTIGVLVSYVMESLHAARRELDRRGQALREREERMRMAVESANIGAWDFDVETGEHHWSDRTKLMYGLQPQDDVTHVPFLQLVHPDDRERVHRAIDRALASDSAGRYETEYRICRGDGTVRWILAKGQAFFVGGGAERRAVRFIGTVLDHTNQKQVEDTLKEADRRKDQFLAVLAHELRNPLAPISNALQIWPLIENDHQRLVELRTMMQRQVEHIARLIDDLMDVSRITRGKVELQRRVVDVRTAVRDAIESARPLLDSRAHQLTVDLPPGPVMVWGDVARLTQVFGNIVNNAAKFTDRGGAVAISVERRDDRVAVCIRDNGPGIPDEMRTTVFEMFRQVDDTLTRSQGGLGIGLTLVKQLVELHGGTVDIASGGPNRGTECVVLLPCLAPTAVPPADDDVRRPLLQSRPGENRRLLVVDDVAASAETLAMMLRAMGHVATVLNDSSAALSWIEEHQPDGVFLDIAMPGMDGYEVARRIHLFNLPRRPLLIALTGYGQDEDRQRAFDAGFDHHVVKPISANELERILAELPPPGTIRLPVPSGHAARQ